jgi:hypothetical protein
MSGRVRCILYMGVVTGLIGLTPALCQQPAGSKVVSPQQPGAGQPGAVQQQPLPYAYPSRSARPAPAAQYSPLAAQGGYRGQKMTWYEALFRSLNPTNIDWGMSWERRRSIFLENSIGNKYFMYTAALSLLLVYSFVVIVWQGWNHAERLRQLAQRAADAMNYAQYWKAGAEKAARKHNTHIEKCNRVIEAGESGLPAGDTADVGALRQQVEGMRVEVLNLTSENKRLRHDLEQKSTVVADLSARVDDATKKIGSGNGPGNGAKGAGENSVQVATLVDRINRLEETLRSVRLENERLKGA